MAESEIYLLLYGVLVGLVAGGVAGTLAGLAGVGGGLIYVPVFYIAMPGDSQNMSIHVLASLVAVVITGFFSARAHWRLNHVDLVSFRMLIPGLVFGAGLGLWLTLHIPEAVVLVSMAAIDAWIAFDYGKKIEIRQGNSKPLLILSGPVGMISGVLGIGGGTMLVPLLRRVCNLRVAVGTSALCGVVMAAGAVLLNLGLDRQWLVILDAHGLFVAGLWGGVLMAMPQASGFAAKLHQRFSEEALQKVLRGLFVFLSLMLLLAAALS